MGDEGSPIQKTRDVYETLKVRVSLPLRVQVVLEAYKPLPRNSPVENI